MHPKLLKNKHFCGHQEGNGLRDRIERGAGVGAETCPGRDWLY